ncbi:MAG: hypothetical protein ACYS99_16135 [Planctomycetota bacterium]
MADLIREPLATTASHLGRGLERRAGGDPAHLKEAHGLFCHLRDHAPEEYRETMIENVPLHRDITQAWEEHGAGQT